jgi:S-adenosylmethionine synthetase
MENVYSKLKGKNLCNLIANIIVEEFKKIDLNNKTRIFVTKHNNFFVVDGMTSINTPLNISELVNKYMISKTNDEKYMPLNFIDLISYDEYTQNHLNIMESFYNNSLDFKDDTSPKNQPIISDEYFGLSVNTIKTYMVLSKYISYNLIERNLCNRITISMNGREHLLESIEEENIQMEFIPSNLIVTKDWLESLVRDLFPFKLIDIINHLKLNDYNFEDEILVRGNYPWKKRDKVSEMILM